MPNLELVAVPTARITARSCGRGRKAGTTRDPLLDIRMLQLTPPSGALQHASMLLSAFVFPLIDTKNPWPYLCVHTIDPVPNIGKYMRCRRTRRRRYLFLGFVERSLDSLVRPIFQLSSG